MTVGQERLRTRPSPRPCAELVAADLSPAGPCKMGSVGPGLVPWACPPCVCLCPGQCWRAVGRRGVVVLGAGSHLSGVVQYSPGGLATQLG